MFTWTQSQRAWSKWGWGRSKPIQMERTRNRVKSEQSLSAASWKLVTWAPRSRHRTFPGPLRIHSCLPSQCPLPRTWVGFPLPSICSACYYYYIFQVYSIAVRRSIIFILYSEVKIAQSIPTLCVPMGYTVHGILQVRTLEWIAFPFSRGSFQPRDGTQVFRTAGRFFTS